MKDAIDEEVQSSVDDAVEDALLKSGIKMEDLEGVTDMVNTVNKEGMKNLTQFATSPQGFMEHGLIRLLQAGGPAGMLATAIITAATGGPALTKAVIEALGVKGGPLNQDYKFSQAEQTNQEFDRYVLFKRITGDDPVITVTTKGYVVGDPDFVDNSLLDINKARTGRVGLTESSLSYIHGI